MSWKEFLKPITKKFIFAVIIFIIISFVPIIPYYCAYRCAGCEGIEYRPMIAGCKFVSSTYLVVLLEIAMSYLLSCWFVKIFKKK
ncbi:MAG: hypothetical protein C0412_13615 [Flavobacterium sp.]|nr:hypothetical protein [Flavobacterium sp.]